jgi:putative ABC transport system permease protein
MKSNKVILAFVLFKESVSMAVKTIQYQKIRSFLSVLGISIGIFSIVMVYTLISSLEIQIKDSLKSLGNNVVYIDVFPWESENRREYPWWKYVNRPKPSLKEFARLDLSPIENLVEYKAFSVTAARETIKNPLNQVSVENISLKGISIDFNKIREMEIDYGRYFTPSEMENSINSALIGSKIATQLFGNIENAINKEIKIGNNKIKVIGVLKSEGENMMGMSMDEEIYIPVFYFNYLYSSNLNNYSPTILLKAKANVGLDAMALELRGIFRSIRRLDPADEDNFALNKVTFLTQYLDDFFGTVNLFGLVIGGFSLLVGGFGVANIMFVSVKERTNIIGIQKALGAKNSSILQQFLTESVILCIFGGLIGMFFVWIVLLAGNMYLGTTDQTFRMVLTIENIGSGVVFSVVTGLVAGIIPAWSASKLEPVEAIRAS